ncbi:MAG: phenylalanine--tRNA ligase subunit beta [Planctomycetaceae bacterium]|nr:phenylalanine--tRNA ligase subunit beta [Planctomycetaceae bacterium]
MIVSTNWLSEYVDLPKSLDELTERLTLTGLNLEGVETVGDDTGVDLEVTSNRPDCLGHVGVAREIAVLWEKELKIPTAKPQAAGQPVSALALVAIEAPQLCSRYTARVIKGVKIGPSPEWLANRLRTLGIAVINNVVDATNYVMMECGQPLHAFDFAKLNGGAIIVRESQPGEKFTAINHQEYELPAGTCVIADAKRAVALAGVMGGADSEVSDATVDLLIESADFDCMSVRSTARALNLHSPSSYRFERGVDPEGIDWASRRCCELILELAGGQLCDGVLDEGSERPARPEIKLRFEQLPRVLGIEVPKPAVRKILTDLGCEETHECDHCVKVIPPSWRADLTREIDLIEEVARIHGYEQIPEDAGVRMAASTRTRSDRVLEKVRGVMVAAGLNEALTLSAVEASWCDAFRPWTNAEPLAASTPVLRGANCLRQSLVPSLLTARRHNEKLSNPEIELFEIAKVYLPQSGDELPAERRVLSATSGRGFFEAKGVVESVVAAVAPAARIAIEPAELPLLDPARQATVRLGDAVLGVLGELSESGREQFELRGPATVFELDLELLIEAAELRPIAQPLSPYPPVSRDLNIVVDEAVRWSAVEETARTAGGELVESIAYQETYRDEQRLGVGKKSLLFGVQLRSAAGTLTSEQADAVRDRIVVALGKSVGGALRA